MTRTAHLLAAATPFLFAGVSPAQGAGTAGPLPVREAPVPRGDRLLGVSVTIPEDGDFDAAFASARDAGLQFVSVPIAWDVVETAPGVYGSDPNWLAIADAFYSPLGVRVSLELNPIDTNNLRVPADLADLPFDDPAVVERYRDLVDWVFLQIPNLQLTSFVVGNEVDGYLGGDAALWSDYEDFFREAATHVRSLRPGLIVGSKITFEGHTGNAAAFAQSLNRSTDRVMVTHYPLAPDFTVHPPASVHASFATITELYPGRGIFFNELGYPSGALCGSSETLQARFVRHAFRAWDDHREAIELVEFVWMHDVSPEQVDAFEEYYGISDPAFLAYLATLGLRTYGGSGTDKKAWPTFVAEAAARGW